MILEVISGTPKRGYQGEYPRRQLFKRKRVRVCGTWLTMIESTNNSELLTSACYRTLRNPGVTNETSSNVRVPWYMWEDKKVKKKTLAWIHQDLHHPYLQTLDKNTPWRVNPKVPHSYTCATASAAPLGEWET